MKKGRFWIKSMFCNMWFKCYESRWGLVGFLLLLYQNLFDFRFESLNAKLNIATLVIVSINELAGLKLIIGTNWYTTKEDIQHITAVTILNIAKVDILNMPVVKNAMNTTTVGFLCINIVIILNTIKVNNLKLTKWL